MRLLGGELRMVHENYINEYAPQSRDHFNTFIGEKNQNNYYSKFNYVRT